MPSISKHLTENSSSQHGIKISQRDAASPAEMRHFLAEMPELDTRQIMGAASEGSLTRGIAVATVGTVVLMAVMTIGPYAWKQAMAGKSAAAIQAEKEGAKPGTAEATGAEKAVADKSTTDKAPAEKLAAEKSPAGADGGQPVVNAKTLERLGVDEVKSADPGVNPLDSKIDDLLDKAK